MLKKMLSFGPFVFEEEETKESDSSPSEAIQNSQTVGSDSKIVWALSVVVAVLAVTNAGVGYLYYQNPPASHQTIAEITPAVQLVLPLTEQIGKHIVLPANEKPEVGTVVDIKKLLGQPFFLHAKNGDRMLIYPKAQVAYLYRPSIDKVINVGPVVIQNQAAQKPQIDTKPQIPGTLEVLGAATAAAGVEFERYQR